MKYLLYLSLVYLEEKTLDAVPDSDCMAYGEALRKSGHSIAAEALARDLNEAIQVASKIPPARLGGVEVRPIRELLQQ